MMARRFPLVSSLGILALALSCVTLQARPRYVTYERFGAVGDGVHDDLEAIVKAHAAANEWKLPVKAGSGKTYFIGGGAAVAEIRTDVDWGDACFIIDDRDCEMLQQPIFTVVSDSESREIPSVKSLRKGQENLGVKLRHRSLVVVQDSTQRVYIRKGKNQNSGTPKREIILVEPSGAIDPGTALVWDYDRITGLKAYPADDKPLTLRGGVFKTVANRQDSQYRYHGRGIAIRRSHVKVEGLTHLIEGEGDNGAPYSGFLSVSCAADVTISDCTLTGHKTYHTIGSAGQRVPMGSYDLTANQCARLTVRHCRQTNDITDRTYWGLFASNFCKDIRMEDCVFSRFDAHMGVKDILLKDCTFGHQGVQAVGFGKMEIEGCEVRRSSLVMLRSDYGSFWDGEIVIRSCTLAPPPGSKDATLVGGSNDGSHDFGYPCMLPRKVVVEGLTVEDAGITGAGYKGPAVFARFSAAPGDRLVSPLQAEGDILARGVLTRSALPLRVSANPSLSKRYTLQTE